MTRPRYEVDRCEDTQMPALYRHFKPYHSGAMEGRELIAHVKEFSAIKEALAKHRQAEELKHLDRQEL